jgi:phosphate starvation-inducible PhoH-like protein
MGKRNAVKRLKSAQDVRASSWNNEPVRGKGAHLQMIEGGRGWHPDDGDEIRNEIPHERTQRYQKTIKPRSENQAQLMNAMDSHALVCALGPAGTGKTYLAIVKAVEALQKGKVSKIILSRPPSKRASSSASCPAAWKTSSRPTCARSTTRSPTASPRPSSSTCWLKASSRSPP